MGPEKLSLKSEGPPGNPRSPAPTGNFQSDLLKCYHTAPAHLLDFGEIHTRIGNEIPLRKLRRVLEELCKKGAIVPEGERRGRRYLLTKVEENRPDVVNRNGQ